MASLAKGVFCLLIPTTILVHLFVAPYTKVEESFNIQAIHDILVSGVPWRGNALEYFTKHYDHSDFPGSVPRTFAGALGLAELVRPLLSIAGRFGAGYTLGHVQLFVRGLLGLLNGFALISFAKSVSRAFGSDAVTWYVLLQASQFHVNYYASRTLPNIFAMIFTTLALKGILDASRLPQIGRRKYRASLFLLTVAGVVFRSELAILVATFTLFLFLNGRLSMFRDIVPAGFLGLAMGLLITVPLDSFFWQKWPLWPEWSAFYYNTIQGHSADWGVSPWHFYFTSALPRLLLNPLTYLFCIPVAVLNPATRARSLDLVVPLISFVSIYSLLPHKEARFILYVTPGLTGVAAAGASWIWVRRSKSMAYALLSLALVASILASFIASTGLLLISALNYPGGHALAFLHESYIPHHTDIVTSAWESQRTVNVYIDNLAAQTGVTRFLEDHTFLQPSLAADEISIAQPKQRRWTYDKSDNATLRLDPHFWAHFDYVLVERPEKVIGKFNPIREQYAYGGIRVLRPGVEAKSMGPEWVKEQARLTASRSLTSEDAGVMDGLVEMVAGFWAIAEELFRERVCRGWWVKIVLDTKVWVLERCRDDECGEIVV